MMWKSDEKHENHPAGMLLLAGTHVFRKGTTART
jgi:hypothetical protein